MTSILVDDHAKALASSGSDGHGSRDDAVIDDTCGNLIQIAEHARQLIPRPDAGVRVDGRPRGESGEGRLVRSRDGDVQVAEGTAPRSRRRLRGIRRGLVDACESQPALGAAGPPASVTWTTSH